MSKRIFPLFFLLIFLIFVQAGKSTATTAWKKINKGLEYASIRVSPGIIHAFRVEPKNHKFKIVTAKGMGRLSASVESMAKKHGAPLAINGGFFTPEYESLGLLISDGKTINPLRKTNWWSIFFIKNDTPHIRHTKHFRNDSSVSMAVQSGPRLVVNGSIPKLKPSIAERSAICVNRNKDVIVIATENLLIQPVEFAEYLRKSEADGGLGCVTALNLDGGSSTQLYARVGSFSLSVPGTNKVANAVVVYPK